MNKLHVALTLLKLLSEYRNIDSGLVAEKMEVSRRTAQRYLEELAAMPFIEHDPENHKYRLVPEYKLETNYIYDTQIAFISAMLNYTSEIFGDDSFVKSVSERFSKNITGAVPLILHEKPEERDKELYDQLSQHINMGNTVSFKYDKYDRAYEVVPINLIYDNGFYYLAAVRLDDNGVIKKFALSFISDVSATGKTSDVDLSHLDLNIGDSIWSGGGKTTTVLLRISNIVADYFKRRPIFPQQNVIHESEDSILLECKVYEADEFMQAALPWANYITILEPLEYKEEYLKTLRKGIELNS